MQVYFGESVRRLRREKGLTQEQLAAQLNVSFQTISNWERNESWPDLSMLPVLAGFFGVRTDDLLGVDRAEQEREITQLLDGFYSNAFIREGLLKYEVQKARLKQLLKECPNDYRLWALHFSLITSLCPEDTAERVRARLPEVRPIYDNIMERCTNVGIRADVNGTMCHFLTRIVRNDPENCGKERAELERIVSELPDLYHTRQYVSTMHLARPSDEMKAVCQSSIMDLLGVFHGMVTHLMNHSDDEREDLRIRYVLNDVYGVMFPDGDYGAMHGWAMGNWMRMTHRHATLEEFDEAFAAMRQAVELALRFDAQPQTMTHTSPMLRGHVFEKPEWDSFAETMRKQFTGALCYPWPWPEEFKADPRFGEILAMLGE